MTSARPESGFERVGGGLCIDQPLDLKWAGRLTSLFPAFSFAKWREPAPASKRLRYVKLEVGQVGRPPCPPHTHTHSLQAPSLCPPRLGLESEPESQPFLQAREPPWQAPCNYSALGPAWGQRLLPGDPSGCEAWSLVEDSSDFPLRIAVRSRVQQLPQAPECVSVISGDAFQNMVSGEVGLPELSPQASLLLEFASGT